MRVISLKEKGLYANQRFHPECSERISFTLDFLREKGVEVCLEDFTLPEVIIEQVHTKEYIENLKKGRIEDRDSPAFPNIFRYASQSAGVAVFAATTTFLTKENTFALIRPPGHHAGADRAMGFCYLNNMALACRHVRNQGEKVAILDIDNHHGNGTEELVTGLERVLFVDIHKTPDYPGTGNTSHDNCINYPLIKGSDEKRYLEILDMALKNISDFHADIILVSAGFDTHRLDPVGDLGLETESYREIAKRIKSLNLPVCSLLEGGYGLSHLPESIHEYIMGLE